MKKTMPSLKSSFIAVFFLMLWCGCAAFALSQDQLLAEARNEMAKFREESSAVTAAMTQDDQPGAMTHQKTAEQHLRGARDLFQRAGASDSKNCEVLKEYAEALSLNGDYDLAAETLDKAVILCPEDAEAWIALGQARARLGDIGANSAVTALRHALALEPETTLAADAWTTLGKVYRKQGLPELARESFDKALSLVPNLSEAQIGLALVNIQEGRLNEAVTSIDSMTNLSPAQVISLNAEAAESLRDFEQSRRLIPDSAPEHLAYAKLLLRVNRFDDCVWPLERAVVLDDKNVVAWNFLGSVCRQLGLIDRAREAFTRSLELKPDDARTRTALQELASAGNP